jgi:hypothetical protein
MEPSGLLCKALPDKTRVVVTDSERISSLLRDGIIYGRKKFYSIGPVPPYTCLKCSIGLE